MKKLWLIWGMIFLSLGLLACESEEIYTLTEVIEAIEIEFSGDDQQQSITNHITLPQQSELMKNAAISWSSSNPTVLDEYGTVNRQFRDTEVTLTLTVVLNGLSDTKSITVTVKGTKVYQVVTINYHYETLMTEDYELLESISEEVEVGILFDGSKIVTGFAINTEQSQVSGLITAEEPLILNIYFDRDVYEFKYYSEGIQIDEELYQFGQTIVQIDDLSLSGFEFGGWSTTPDGMNPYTFGGLASSHVTLYAIWIADAQYTGYYSSINNISDANLRTTLRILLNQGLKLPYTGANTVLNVSDRDPNRASNVLLVYNRASVSGIWDGGNTWNKEHVWPRFYLPDDHSEDDYHNLKPSTPSVNSQRSNYRYGPGAGLYRLNSNPLYFFPGDADKGDIARIIFYMQVRYNLILSINSVGELGLFLQWHIEDPVDDFERNRNEVIFNVQQNRNPFIDHPELVERIWGKVNTDSSSNQEALWMPTFEPTFKVIEIIAYEVDISSMKREQYQL